MLLEFDLGIRKEHSHRPKPYDANYFMYTHTQSLFKN